MKKNEEKKEVLVDMLMPVYLEYLEEMGK